MDMALMSDLEIVGDLVVPGGALQGLNDVEIVGGDEDTALVLESLQASGVPPRLAQTAAQRLARQMGTARKIDPNAVLVRQQMLRDLGYQPVGVPATTFEIANATKTIEVEVVRPFKPYELIVGSDIAQFFVLLSASINGRNQLANSQPVPLITFSEASYRSKFRWETINPSSPLVLQVQMIELSQNRVFYARFDGAAVMK